MISYVGTVVDGVIADIIRNHIKTQGIREREETISINDVV